MSAADENAGAAGSGAGDQGGQAAPPPAGADKAGAAGAAAGAANGDGKAPPAKEEKGGVEAELKVPDKFLVDGKPDYNKVLKSYTELERAQFRRREEVAAEVKSQLAAEQLASLPATPGDYKIEPTFKVGDRDITIVADDPMLNWLKSTAHEFGVAQKDVNKIVQGYVTQMIAAQPSWTHEAAVLGPNADQRHQRVDGWLKGNLSDENYATIAQLPATAARIKAFEELMVVAGSPPIADNASELPGEVYTRDELKAMMRDPRYSGIGGKTDNAYVAKVRAGFQRLSKAN